MKTGRPPNKIKYTCEICGIKFRRKIPFLEHLREHGLYLKRRY